MSVVAGSAGRTLESPSEEVIEPDREGGARLTRSRMANVSLSH
jgi:hypothetical protein